MRSSSPTPQPGDSRPATIVTNGGSSPRFRWGWMAMAAATLVAGCAGGTASTARLDDGPDPQRRGPQGRVAQFIVECDLSHLAYDDPIVFPDSPGESHLHQFFGNTMVDADPDYDRVAGASTSCEQALDTASYWAPALLDADGNRVDTLGMTAYYRPGSGVEPEDVVAYPPGLMLIGGDVTSTEPQPLDIVAWSCGTGAMREERPPACPDGSSLRMLIKFPDCWDGEHLHGDGLEVPARYSDGGCPADFPVPVPQLLLAVDYPPVDPEGLSLASGSILTAHADFWNVWDQAKLEEEVALCLNRDLVCGVSDGRSGATPKPVDEPPPPDRRGDHTGHASSDD